jgi:hypothetical protein
MLEKALGFLGENERGGGQGADKGIGAHRVEDGLIKPFTAKTLRGEEIGIKALENFRIVHLIFLEEWVFLDRGNELFGLGIDSSKVGSLDLKQTDPGLKIEKLVLLGGRNPSCLESDFEKSLALGCNKVIQVERATSDFSQDLGGGISSTFGSPVTKKDEGDPNNGQEDEKEAF